MPRFRHVLGTLLAVLLLLLLSATSAPAAPSRASHPKASSPQTDLAHYPKHTGLQAGRPASPARASGAAAAEEVRVVKHLANGVTSMTFYDPAPGASPRALAASLRASGVQGVEIVSTATSNGQLRAAESCSYGTARSIGCPPVHWRNNGYADPQVYFNDHTGASWPTDQAVYTWNQSYGIDSYYRWNSCPALSGVHCVNVYSGNYGATTWAGRTTVAWDAGLNLLDGRVYVQLNDYYYYNADGFRQNACHELGHALALDHNVQNYSCMWYQIVNGAHRTPDPDDFNMLASIYSVVR